MNRISMTYALKDNVLTSISEVESGLKCGCVCPQCGAALVAHKGTKLSHHFKHYNAKECEGGYQTSLHLLAKEIISQEKRFIIPPVIYNHSFNGYLIDFPATEIIIDKVELEAKTGDIIPDIVIHCGNQILLVEIYVTHRIDEAKLAKIESLGLSTIEIDLSKTDREISYDSLKNLLLNDCSEKKWIFNKYISKLKKYIYSVSRLYNVTNREIKSVGITAAHIDNCPIRVRSFRGKAYANYIEDCWICPYLAESNYNQDDELVSIRCLGEKKIAKLDDLKIGTMDDLKKLLSKLKY